MIDNIKIWIEDKKSSWYRFRLKEKELEKYRDPRRLAIANNYLLTKDQKKQIDQLYVNNYGYKIDYVWHQNYAAHAERFDYNYFPELLYIPEFEAFQNQNVAATRMIADKNFLPILAKSVGVRMPRVILSCTNGILRDEDNRIISESKANEVLKNKPTVFIKPSVDTSSGQGCKMVNSKELDGIYGKVLIVNGGVDKYMDNYVVQDCIQCHESIYALYPNSVNTFRVISYLWHDRIELMPIIIRIGQGGNYLDNAHAGGMFCAVSRDGSLGKFAVTEFNNKYFEHPDTKVVFALHKIDNVVNVAKSAVRLHEAIPQIGVINWDFTLDKVGDPILIEANSRYGSIWLPQMAHGVGAFGNKTIEVLQWLRFMNTIKPHERLKFVGGIMG